jgi:hydrogenase nickel incorporation protein HypA/HybF
MHELSIAQSVLEAVRAEADRRPGMRICKVGLRVGELAGLDPEALQFGFEILVRESEFKSLQLEIEHCPRRQRCPQCGNAFTPREYELACPACGAARTECIGGDELEIAYLEIEEETVKAGEKTPGPDRAE